MTRTAMIALSTQTLFASPNEPINIGPLPAKIVDIDTLEADESESGEFEVVFTFEVNGAALVKHGLPIDGSQKDWFAGLVEVWESPDNSEGVFCNCRVDLEIGTSRLRVTRVRKPAVGAVGKVRRHGGPELRS